MEYSTNIKRWPVKDRPREKAYSQGVESLSDAELLALILGKGTRKKSAVDLSKEILMKFKNLKNISTRSPSEFLKIKGIGKAKAVTIAAAFELGRRADSGAEETIIFKSPADVAEYLIPLMGYLKKEIFRVLLLNSRNRLIKDVKISEGSILKTVVSPQEVFREAILERATGIILAHNHPGGSPEPSEEDVSLTQKLVRAGELFEIRVLDHIIISGSKFFSMAQEDLIK